MEANGDYSDAWEKEIVNHLGPYLYTIILKSEGIKHLVLCFSFNQFVSLVHAH